MTDTITNLLADIAALKAKHNVTLKEHDLDGYLADMESDAEYALGKLNEALDAADTSATYFAQHNTLTHAEQGTM